MPCSCFSRFLLPVLLLFSSPFPAQSAAPTGLALSIEGAANHALLHNPSLAAATLRIREARGKLQQSGRLPNPELEWEWTRNTTGIEGSTSISLLQRFPLTARLKYERIVSRHELAAAEAEVRDASRKLATETRLAAIKLLALDLQSELRSKQLATSHELSAFLRKRTQSGEASSIELAQAELDAHQQKIELLQLANQRAVLTGQLASLLGVSAKSALAIKDTLRVPKALPTANAPHLRPDVQAARERAHAAGALLQQHRSSQWEDLGIGFSYSRERRLDEPFPVKTEHLLGLRFSLPLPLWRLHAGRIHEAEASAEKALKESEAAKLAAENESSASEQELHSLAPIISELESSLLPKAALIEAKLRESYDAGQASLHEVLRARARTLELQRLRLDSLRDYNLARARFDAPLIHTPQTTPPKKGTRP